MSSSQRNELDNRPYHELEHHGICFGFGGILKMGGARDKIYPGVTEEILFTFHCDILRNFLRLRNKKVSGVKKVLVER